MASAVKHHQSAGSTVRTYLLWVAADSMPLCNAVRLLVVSVVEQFTPVVGGQVRPLPTSVLCCGAR